MDINQGEVSRDLVPRVVLSILIGAAHDQSSFFANVADRGPFSRKLESQTEVEVMVHLNYLVQQWLYSGKDPINPEVDVPTARNLVKVHPDFKRPLIEVLKEWIMHHPPEVRFSADGSVSIAYIEPIKASIQPGISGNYKGLFGTANRAAEPLDVAIYWFVRLLDSPGAHRLAQCVNCRQYFLYKRPQGLLKQGTFCPRCNGAYSKMRTESRRQREKMVRIALAAEVWDSWKPGARMGQDKAGWVARKINAKLGVRDKPASSQWVKRNTKYIEKHLDTAKI